MIKLAFQYLNEAMKVRNETEVKMALQCFTDSYLSPYVDYMNK